tara:strand:+ start:1419 stop:2126 length:708 start_codon:yes stop_codon:yes gene_type:complete
MLEKIFNSRFYNKFLYYRYRLKQRNWTVYELLHQRSVEKSTDYIENYLSEVLIFPSRESLWKYSVSLLEQNSRIIELGVYKGYSINHLADYSNAKDIDIWGFDTFEGLSGSWFGTSFYSGSYSNNGLLPKTRSNVTLKKGDISDTIPNFLKINERKISLIHFDLDTRDITLSALNILNSVITDSILIIFDEYHGFPSFENGEKSAWKDFALKEKLSWKYLAFSNQQALIKVSISN